MMVKITGNDIMVLNKLLLFQLMTVKVGGTETIGRIIGHLFDGVAMDVSKLS